MSRHHQPSPGPTAHRRYDAYRVTVLKARGGTATPTSTIGPRRAGLHQPRVQIIDDSVDGAHQYADAVDVTLSRLRRGPGQRQDDRHPPDRRRGASSWCSPSCTPAARFRRDRFKVSAGSARIGSSVMQHAGAKLDAEVRQKGHMFRMSWTSSRRLAPGQQVTDERHDDHVLAQRRDLRLDLNFDFDTLRPSASSQVAFLNTGLTDQRSVDERLDRAKRSRAVDGRQRVRARTASTPAPQRPPPQRRRARHRQSRGPARSPTATTVAWSTTSTIW